MDERFSWGGIEVYLNITNGIIEEANLYTDSLDPTPFESLSELLVGAHYDKDSINTLINNLLTENQDSQDQINEFQNWLIGEIE